MKVLMVGDIVGAPGRSAFAQVATRLKHEGKVDFVVANAENAAGGRGLTGTLAEEILAGGADVITLGDHTWDQRELAEWFGRDKRVIRPVNYPPGCPGSGLVTLDTQWGGITVINLIGRVFMQAHDCPFRAMDALLGSGAEMGRTILVDLHAEATSEKIVFGRYLDGRVSCVVGTHTHVQTSDDAVLPKGTAYITDLGMTGAKDSAIGRDLASITERFLTGMPTRFKMAKDDVKVEGVIVDIDESNGRARGIKRLRESV